MSSERKTLPGLRVCKLRCGHARKNSTRHLISSAKCASQMRRRSMSPELWQSESTCHMGVGERQPQSKHVGRLNALQVD